MLNSIEMRKTKPMGCTIIYIFKLSEDPLKIEKIQLAW